MKGEDNMDGVFQSPHDLNSSILGIGGPNLYDAHFLNDMHEKTLQMGQSSIPRIKNSIILMKNELQNMVKAVQPFLDKQISESSIDAGQF